MSPAADRPYLRLAVFTAFAAFVAAEWMTLVADPPLARALLCPPVVALGGLALILLGASRLGKGPRVALAALVVLLGAAAALLVVGLPARLLAPGNWSELGSSVHSGLEGLEDVDYPYTGDRPWSRLAIMLVLPLALTCSAALAFWPRADRPTRPPLLALAILVAVYASALINDAASHPLLRGAALFGFVAAWLWLPGLGRRQVVAVAAIATVAAAIAVPAASALDANRPWLDHSEWDFAFSGQGEDEAFDWDHGYGPIDWPRTGRMLLEVRSRSAHYWRAAVLDSFDGVRWQSSHQLRPSATELPARAVSGSFDSLPRKWIEWIGYEFESLRSPEVISAGPVDAVRGSEVGPGPSGTRPRDGTLEDGDSYALRTYVPDPDAELLRDSPPGYSPLLTRYTTILAPVLGQSEDLGIRQTIPVPLWGSADRSEAEAQLADSPYGPVSALARRWTSGTSSAFDAVAAIRDRLRDGYTYSETPPRHRFPLRAFLLGDRIGYCQQFSGAMALMLRMIGIPSRVASGFSPGSRSGEVFVVRDYDAHSWVEVYFNAVGWVPFDPTPAAAPAQLQSEGPASVPPNPATPPTPATPPAPAPGSAANLGRGASGGPTLWPFAAALVAVLATAGLPTALRRRRWRSLTEGVRVDAQLRELEAALRRLGHRVPGGTTLKELERRLGRGRPMSTAYAGRLRAARFAPGKTLPPTLGERRRLRRELSSGAGARARLRGLLAFPPGAPSPPAV